MRPKIGLWCAAALFAAISVFFADIFLAFAAVQRRDTYNLDAGLWSTPMPWPPFWGGITSVPKPITQIALVAWAALLPFLLKRGFRGLLSTVFCELDVEF